MYICTCMGVTDEKIDKAIEEGADTLAKVCSKTGAGRCCKRCYDMIEDKLEDNKE